MTKPKPSNRVSFTDAWGRRRIGVALLVSWDACLEVEDVNDCCDESKPLFTNKMVMIASRGVTYNVPFEHVKFQDD